MGKDTQITTAGQQSPQRFQPAQPVNLIQNGNDNTQIAYVEKYEQSVVVLPGVQSAGMPVIGQGVTFNYDCFSLFVIGTEQYDEPCFIVPKDRALTESTSQEIKNRCASLSPEAVSIIKTFPAIFCSENHHYANTDPDHMAYYGYVTEIKVQDRGIHAIKRSRTEMEGRHPPLRDRWGQHGCLYRLPIILDIDSADRSDIMLRSALIN